MSKKYYHKSAALYGKLYLIPTTMGLRPNGCFTTNHKRTIDFIDHYIVENDKTAKSIKEVNPEKKQSDLILFTLNKRTETNILILSNLYLKVKIWD
jgi:16S rRNA (cytidine1402-2'-O)-methyltransferase